MIKLFFLPPPPGAGRRGALLIQVDGNLIQALSVHLIGKVDRRRVGNSNIPPTQGSWGSHLGREVACV